MKKSVNKLYLYLPLLVVIFTMFLGIFDVCHAAGLEVDYPTSATGETITDSSSLPNYMKYIFDIGMTIGVLATVLSLIIGGVLYILSTASPELRSSAMDRVEGAISGFVLLLLTYLIVTTINPSLSIFKVNQLTSNPTPTEKVELSPGTHIYTANNCPDTTDPSAIKSFVKDSPDLGDFKNRVKSLKIVSNAKSNSYYVAILHDFINLRGGCQFFSYNDYCFPSPAKVSPEASSISVYKYDFNTPGGSVTFYRKPLMNPEGGSFTVLINDLYQQELSKLFYTDTGDKNGKCNVPEKERDCSRWDTKTNKCLEKSCPSLAGNNIGSIKIGGNFVVILLHYNPGVTGSDYKWVTCQTFPTPDDKSKSGPQQIRWEYIKSEPNLPNYVVVMPIK